MPGEVAALIAEGTLCAGCRVYLDDQAEGYPGPCGHPRYCRRCGGRAETNGRRPDGDSGRERKRRD